MIKEIKYNRLNLIFDKVFNKKNCISIYSDGSVSYDQKWMICSSEVYFYIYKNNLSKYLKTKDIDIPLDFIIERLNKRNLEVLIR